ncbi:MAG: hypothetical protein Q8K93_28845, partial [Reyranella sp.]|nr:hypothetical protein [Reyranella sp.]
MIRVCLTVLAVSLFAFSARAEPRAMTALDLVTLEKLSDPTVSPDGRLILFSRDRVNWQANAVEDDIWRIGVDGRDPLRLIEGPASGFQWSPDSRSFAFIAKRPGDTRRQIYVSSVDGGKPRRVGKRRTSPTSLRWSPDGASLYFLADELESRALAKRRRVLDDMLPFETPQA